MQRRPRLGVEDRDRALIPHHPERRERPRYDAAGNLPTADEIVAAVTRLMEQKEDLLDRLDSTEVALQIARRENDKLRWELEDLKATLLDIRHMELPNGRPGAFVEDAMVFAISPAIDADAEVRLLAQVEPPKLTTCNVCGAPVYEDRACTMH